MSAPVCLSLNDNVQLNVSQYRSVIYDFIRACAQYKFLNYTQEEDDDDFRPFVEKSFEHYGSESVEAIEFDDCGGAGDTNKITEKYAKKKSSNGNLSEEEKLDLTPWKSRAEKSEGDFKRVDKDKSTADWATGQWKMSAYENSQLKKQLVQERMETKISTLSDGKKEIFIIVFNLLVAVLKIAINYYYLRLA